MAEEDTRSPFFGREYSEFQFTQTVYNYYIHPQWDDAIENDVMTLKREIIDRLIAHGIRKFILIGENVLNFHSSDDCYYEEWYEDVSEEGGWVTILGLPEQSRYDFTRAGVNRYVFLTDVEEWRTYSALNLYTKLDNLMMRRIG
jgi:hypothetical protein